MSNLVMSFDEVTAQGNSIVAKAEDVTALQQWLTRLVNDELPQLWQGSGYEGYATRVADMAPSFNAMYELIVDIGQGLIHNAEEYRDFDQTMGSSNGR